MEKKVKVEIFGIPGEPARGGCSCSGACGPSLTIGEQYKGLEEFFEKSDLSDKIELNFIDISSHDPGTNKDVNKLLDSGYALPIICFDNNPRFYGGMSEFMIYEEIKKILEQ